MQMKVTQIKAIWRSALLGAVGLFALSFTSSAQALCLFDCPKTEQATEKTAAGEEAKPVTVRKYKRYYRSRHASRREKVREAARRAKAEKDKAEKAAERKKLADAAPSPIGNLKVPDAVANANALLVGNVPKSSSVIDAYADTQKDGLLQLVSADELNEIDKTAGQPDTLPSKVSPSVANSNAQMQAADASSTWDATSVIGKMFIAFGTLLTLFSAARMFMA